MLWLFVRNLLKYVGILLLASIIIFVSLEILPGNAAQIIMGPDADAVAIAQLEQQLGLDQPALLRYWHWISGFFSLDWGNSYVYHSPVTELVQQRLLVTIPLTLVSLLLAISLATIIAAIACLNYGNWIDRCLMALSQLGIAIPNFWLAFLLIIVFSVQLKWLPAGGFAGWQRDFGASIQALILPCIALTLLQTSIFSRNIRNNLLNLSNESFVLTARAKGLTERYILLRHIFPHALAPIITLIGLQFAALLSGAIVIEQVFSLPGIGQLLLSAIANRDLIVLRSTVLLLVTFILVINLLTNYLQQRFDPRLQQQS